MRRSGLMWGSMRYLGCGCLALACSGAWAGPLNRALVDREANWMVHVDAEAAQKSTFHTFLLKNLDDEDKAKLEECRKRFGITPREIKGVTIYGFNVADDGVAVLTTTGKADELAVKLPEAGLEDFKARVDGNVHYFSFKHENQTWHMAARPSGAPDERLVLIAGNAASLEKGLKVAAGLAPNLTSDVQAGNLLATAQPDKASLVFVVARDMANDPKAKANFLRNAKGVVIDIGETGEPGREVYATLALTAVNAKVAEELKQTCQGMVALGTMLARENKADGLVESLQDIKLVVENDKLTVSSREKSDAIMGKLEALKHMVEVEESEGGKAVKVSSEKPDAKDAAPAEKKESKEPAAAPNQKP